MVQAQADLAAASLNQAGQSVARPERAAPRLNPLNATWQAVGPLQIASQSYGNVTGRVTSVAIDPADATGNTVYLGTTGGGVWKSINAAGATASVMFTPLTDTLPVFSANAGTAAIPSLSIGAVSVENGVVLAGTGDPNDASDSYYGQGILRSADGGVTWTLVQGSHDGVAGNHSFVGLGVAGFAWSSTSPKLVVAALSQAAEGVLVNAPDATYSVMGLYYSLDAGVNWQMATIEDGSQIVQRPMPGGGPGNAATAVVWNAVRQRFYAAVRFHGYYESTDGITWTRLARQPGLPDESGVGWKLGVSDLSRGVGGAGYDGRHVCADGGCGQSRPGNVAGCVRAVGHELRGESDCVWKAIGFGAARGWRRVDSDCAGGL
jgi:hypothetical protein